MLAAETALLLARRGARVLAVDAAVERGTLHYSLDLPLKKGMFSVADVSNVWEDLPDDLLRNTVSRCPSGVSLLPSGGTQMTGRARCKEAAVSLVHSFRSQFDRVALDTGSGGDPFTSGLILASDLVVMVVTPELSCLGCARRALESMDSQGCERSKVLLVVNRSLGARDTFTAEDIESFLGIGATAWLQEDTVRCRRLGDACRPVCSERSALASAIRRLADRLG